MHAAEPASLTDVRVKEVAPRDYLCAKKELKIAQLAEFAMATIPKLVEKATELKLGQYGPIMITYFNFQGDPEQPFTAEIAIAIESTNAAEAKPFYARKTTKLKCASAIFQGPLLKLGETWQTFVTGAMAKGEPTGESRELYHQYEGHDSPNNIVELQLGLK